MSDQLPMFEQMTSPDTPNATFSPESASGLMPSVSPDGQTTEKSGQAPVPVNPLARPAKAKRSTMKGIFGQSGFHSSKHEDLSFALGSKLRQSTDSLGSTLFSLTWMTRATPAGRSISALRASEPLTEGSVFIGWPTAQARDWKGPQGRSYKGTAIDLPAAAAAAAAWPTHQKHDERERGNTMADHHHFPHDLSNMATLAAWPTPVANDDNKTPEAHLAMKQRMGERDGTGANRTAITSLQVMAQLAGWKTPTLGSPNSLRGSGQDPAIREAGGHTVNLQDQVRLSAWQTPNVPNGGRLSKTELGKHRDGSKAQVSPESEAQLTAFGPGPIGYLLGPNGWEIVPASGQLNASHSRWLMGLPESWDQAAIAAFRSLKGRKRGSRGSVGTETA